MCTKQLRYFAVILTAVLFVFSTGLQAASDWKRLDSEHFEMFTTVSAGRARALLDHFERVRQFFLDSMGSLTLPEEKTRLLVMNSQKQWEQYRPNEVAAAFYASGLTRDFIVMGDLSDQSQQTAVHEFTHLIVHNSGAEIPVWLNEGMAQVYSTLTPAAKNVRVGDPPPNVGYTLSLGHWFNFVSLDSVDRDSSFYNEKERAGTLYAQSWLLTHMLMLRSPFREQFPSFFSAIMSGQTGEQAFLSVYGLTPPEVDREMNAYYQANSINAAIVPVRMTGSGERVDAVPATEAEVAITEAILNALVNKTDEALRLLDPVMRKEPQNVEVLEALAEVAWRNGDYETAMEHAGRAVALGSQNSALQWRYAMQLANLDPGNEGLPALMRSVLEGHPENVEVRLRLLEVLNARDDYAGTLEEAKAFRGVRPEHAARFFNATAEAFWMEGDKGAARTAIGRAKETATEPRDVQRAQALEDYFDRSERVAAEREQAMAARAQAMEAAEARQTALARRDAPEDASLRSPGTPPFDPSEFERRMLSGGRELEQVGGRLANLECKGRDAVLSIRDEEENLVRFLIDGSMPTSVQGIDSFAWEFTCGAQKPTTVELEYLPDETGDVVGTVRILRFVEQP